MTEKQFTELAILLTNSLTEIKEVLQNIDSNLSTINISIPSSPIATEQIQANLERIVEILENKLAN